MVEKKMKEEALPPEEKSTKGKTFMPSKKNLFILKVTIFGLLALNIVILMGVFWNRYLEPKFGFDFVSSGQPVAEAMSLSSVVKDTPPSTFQGRPDVSPQSQTHETVPASNDTSHESLLKEIVNAIQGQVSHQADPEIAKLERKIQALETAVVEAKAFQMVRLTKEGTISPAELKSFLRQHPNLYMPDLSNILSQYSFESLLDFTAIEAQVIAAQPTAAPAPQNEKFLRKIKDWLKSLITIEKEVDVKPDALDLQFLSAIQSHNTQLAIQSYQSLPEDLKAKLLHVYSQLLLRDALDKAQRQLLLKNISQG